MYRFLCIAIFGAGLWLPTGLVDHNLASLMVTFFGLLAAGMIPAMSLLVGNALTPSRSVAQIIALKGNLDQLLERLGLMLLTIIIGALSVMALSVAPPEVRLPHQMLVSIPALMREGAISAPERALQATTLVCLFLSVDRLRVVYYAFKTVLNARFRLTIEEAQRTIKGQAPSTAEVAQAFPTQEGFGERQAFGASSSENP